MRKKANGWSCCTNWLMPNCNPVSKNLRNPTCRTYGNLARTISSASRRSRIWAPANWTCAKSVKWHSNSLRPRVNPREKASSKLHIFRPHPFLVAVQDGHAAGQAEPRFAGVTRIQIERSAEGLTKGLVRMAEH